MDVLFPWRRNIFRPAPPPPQQQQQNANLPNNVVLRRPKYVSSPPEEQEEEVGGVSPLRQLLDALNMSILPHDLRLSAIVKALDTFDHRDKRKHDFELCEGSARILYQKLAFALALQQSDHNRIEPSGDRWLGRDAHYSYAGTDAILMQRIRSSRSPDSSDADCEIAMLMSCLEMVHRASSDAIAYTFHDVGVEALPILVKVMERPFIKLQKIFDRAETQNQPPSVNERAVAIATNREKQMAVQKATKILAVYSIVPEAKLFMASCPGLLQVLVKITDTHNMNRFSMTMRASTKKAFSVVGSMSSDDKSESMHSMMSMSTGVSSTSSLRSGQSSVYSSNGVSGSSAGYGLYMTEATRFNAIATLTNLAAAEENRMLMLNEPGLIENIARVVHHERSDMARQCSALAIMNLSNGDREHVPELGGNGLLLDTLIILMKDDSLEARRNAAIALFNVACADENTLKLVKHKYGKILEVLKDNITAFRSEYPLEEENAKLYDEVRTNVAEAIFNISCSSIEEVIDRVANHPDLLESLAITLRDPSASRDVQIYCAATLRRMSEMLHAPKKNQFVLLNALVKASNWTKTTCIAEAFLTQAKVKENRAVMVEHHSLLNSLSKLTETDGGEESDRIRNVAVNAIEFLSREASTRPILSRHEGVMMALTRASYEIKDGASVQDSQRDDDRSVAFSYTSEDSKVSDSRRVQVALKKLVGTM